LKLPHISKEGEFQKPFAEGEVRPVSRRTEKMRNVSCR
jgi:hypothetical protein